jgi:hypothetical protein
MGGSSGISTSGSGRAEQEQAQRRALEESARAKPTARVAAGVADASRPLIERYVPLLATNDALLRAFAENQRSASPALPAPPAFGDLSLYTNDALEREIESTRTRLGFRSGRDADADRLALGHLEAELTARQTPKPVDVQALLSREDVETAIAAERTFLSRHGGAVAPAVRGEHQNRLAALRSRRETFLADERACDGARPVVANLPDGAHRRDFTADDLVASLKAHVPLRREQETAVRATFERWHRDTCRLTGSDPTVMVSRRLHAEANIDQTSRVHEMLRMRMEMLEASRSSGLAALAFLDSAVRGESVDAAHARVKGALALSDVADSLPVAPRRMVAESPREEVHTICGLAQQGAR